jgi:hypothetical protein
MSLSRRLRLIWLLHKFRTVTRTPVKFGSYNERAIVVLAKLLHETSEIIRVYLQFRCVERVEVGEDEFVMVLELF